MESLKINEEQIPAKRAKFLERQFSLPPTLGQRKFDYTFGVVLPIVCIAADPIVFRSWMFDRQNEGLLIEYKVFSYALSSVSILTMTAWLLWGKKLGGVRPFLGGLFLVAAIVSTLVGVAIAPLSAFGIIFYGLGLLGFVPLFAGFVYLRNAFRTLEASAEDLPIGYVVRAAMLAALYALVVPLVLNF